MKKFFIAALVAVSFSASAFADATVSASVRKSFASDFAGATEVQWRTTADYSKATFVQNGVKVEAFYNQNGELFATGKSLHIDELPKQALESIAKKYEGYVIKETATVSVNDESGKYVALESNKNLVVVSVDEQGKVSLFSKTRK